MRKQKVTGIETLVYRIPADAKNKPTHLNASLPVMSEPAPADQRMSRAELIRVALSYTEGLRLGGFVKSKTPFGPEAYRAENGAKYAGEGCVGAKDCDITGLVKTRWTAQVRVLQQSLRDRGSNQSEAYLRLCLKVIAPEPVGLAGADLKSFGETTT